MLFLLFIIPATRSTAILRAPLPQRSSFLELLLAGHPRAPLPPQYPSVPIRPQEKRQRKVVHSPLFGTETATNGLNLDIHAVPQQVKTAPWDEWDKAVFSAIPPAPVSPEPQKAPREKPEGKTGKENVQNIPPPYPKDISQKHFTEFVPPPPPNLPRKKSKIPVAPPIPTSVPTLPVPDFVSISVPPPVTGDVLEQEKSSLPYTYFALCVFELLLSKICALDTEATGLGSGHKLTEIGCTLIENNRIKGLKFGTRLNPERLVNKEAQELTGHTFESLRDQPLFSEVADDFLAFIEQAYVLLLHHAHYDLKLLNEALSACGHTKKLEESYQVIDTLWLANQLHPNEKNNLRDLCNRYGIHTNEKHGALTDAELTAEVFLAMLRKHKDLIFPVITPRKTLPIQDFYNRFEHVNGTPGADYFRRFRLTQELPLAFRFIESMPHPYLSVTGSAIVAAFCDEQRNILGLYTKYLEVPGSDSRVFYGSPENTMATIYTGSPRTVVISDLITALTAQKVLLGDDTEKICKALGIQGSFSIQAFLDLVYMPTIKFSNRTRTVIVIINGKKNCNTGYFNQVMVKSLESLQ